MNPKIFAKTFIKNQNQKHPLNKKTLCKLYTLFKKTINLHLNPKKEKTLLVLFPEKDI